MTAYLNSQFGKRSIKAQVYRFDDERARYGSSMELQRNPPSSLATATIKARKIATPSIPNRLIKHNAHIKKSFQQRKSSTVKKEEALHVRKLSNAPNYADVTYWQSQGSQTSS